MRKDVSAVLIFKGKVWMKRAIKLAIAFLAMLSLVSAIIIIQREISSAANSDQNVKTEIRQPSLR